LQERVRVKDPFGRKRYLRWKMRFGLCARR
jgi:hypothetical protein